MCELGIDKIRFRRRKAGLDMGICWKRNNEIQRATTTSVSKPEVLTQPEVTTTELQVVQDEIS